MDDQTPPLCLTTPVGSDEIAQEPMSCLDIEDWPVVLKSSAVPQAGTCSDDGTQGRFRSFRLPASLHLARPNLGMADIKLLGLTIWGLDNLADSFVF